jgi:sugar phosphate permease
MAWPGLIAVMGNWIGPDKRGSLMGIWTGCSNVGNIIGLEIGSISIDIYQL